MRFLINKIIRRKLNCEKLASTKTKYHYLLSTYSYCSIVIFFLNGLLLLASFPNIFILGLTPMKKIKMILRNVFETSTNAIALL